jgi:hypothetical protein
MVTAATRLDDSGFVRRASTPEGDHRSRYQFLRYQRDSDAYARVAETMSQVALPADYSRIRVIENPANQAVQYGVMHIFSGPINEALELLVEGNEALAEACRTVFFWSNMGAQKDAIIEEQYTYGDVWLQIKARDSFVPGEGQVWLDIRDPADVTEFREDNRRNTKYIRLDFELADVGRDEPNGDGATGRTEKRYWTEVWDHDDFAPPIFPIDDPLFDEALEATRRGRYRVWIHHRGLDAKLDTLGPPDMDVAITDIGGTGADFVPFVRIPRKAGTKPNKRSTGVFEIHVEAIDQLNRIATELDDTYREHSDGIWAILRGEQGKDAIEMIEAEEADEEADEQGREEEYYGRRVIRFPGMSRAEDMVPNIDYQAGLDKIEDHRNALEKSLSELRYFRGVEQGDPSAAALRLHQAPAIKTAEAARGNAEDGVARALGMAITWAQGRGLIAQGVGNYANGDFQKIGFVKRAIIPETPEEKQAREAEEAQILASWKALGPELFEKFLIENRGFSTTEARTIAQAAERREQQERDRALINGI